MSISEELIIISNLALTGATIVAAFVTYKDIHKDEQSTLRALIAKLPTVKVKARGKAKHERTEAHKDDLNLRQIKWGEQA